MKKDFNYLKEFFSKLEDEILFTKYSTMICSVTSHARTIVEKSDLFLEYKEAIEKQELNEEDLESIFIQSLDMSLDERFPFDFAIMMVTRLCSFFPLKNNCLLEKIIKNEKVCKYALLKPMAEDTLEEKMKQEYPEANHILDFLHHCNYEECLYLFYSRGYEQKGPLWCNPEICFDYLVKKGIIPNE